MAPPPFPAANVRWQWRGVGHIGARRADGAPSPRCVARACCASSPSSQQSRATRYRASHGSAASARTPSHQYPECGVGDAAGVDAAPAPADG